LSQYLIEAEYARDTLRPGALAVIVIGNDFDESIAGAHSMEGQHYFERTASGALALQRRDYSPSRVRELIRRSALARYLVLNARLPESWASLKVWLDQSGAGSQPARFVANSPAQSTPERLVISKLAVDKFLRELPRYSGLGPDRIVIVVDAARPQLYAPDGLGAVESSYFQVMRRYLIEQAAAPGYEVIDMEPRFVTHYARNGRRFEFEADGHWNGLGHELTAKAIQESRVFGLVFGPQYRKDP
jgi:hypothetical protein